MYTCTCRSRSRAKVTHVTQVKGDFEVLGEAECELGVEFKDVEEVVAVDLVDVAVRECAHAAVRLSDRRVATHVLPEHVVFP